MQLTATRVVQSLVGLIALGPFAAVALTACESAQTERAPPQGPSAAVAASSVAVVSAASSPVAAEPSASAAVVAAPVSASASEAPPGKTDVYGPCAGARGVAAYIDAHRACTSDTDCSVESTGCGMPGACGVGIQRKAAAGLHAKTNAAVSACMKAGLPLPCATCAPSPPARCGSGYCRP